MIQITAQVSGSQIGQDLADDLEEAAGAVIAFAMQVRTDDEREELLDFLQTEVRCAGSDENTKHCRERLHALGKLLIAV